MSTVASAEDSFFIQFRATEFRPETKDYHKASAPENIQNRNKCHPGFPMPDYLNLPRIPE